MKYQINTEAQVRAAFWAENPRACLARRVGKAHNEQPTDVRVAFVDWLDAAARAGRLPESLAARVTL